jgi:hypothetical protein
MLPKNYLCLLGAVHCHGYLFGDAGHITRWEGRVRCLAGRAHTFAFQECPDLSPLDSKSNVLGDATRFLNHFKSIELRLDDTDYMSTSVKERPAAITRLNGSVVHPSKLDTRGRV